VISAISFLPVSQNYTKIFGILRISIHFAISDFIFVAISTVISVISDRVCDFSDFIKIVILAISVILFLPVSRNYTKIFGLVYLFCDF